MAGRCPALMSLACLWAAIVPGAALGLRLATPDSAESPHAFGPEAAARRAREWRPLWWLHVPKTGASFINAVFKHPGLCPNLPQDAVVTKSVVDADWFAPGHYAERYANDRYCPGALMPGFTPHHLGIFHLSPADLRHRGLAMFRQPEQRIISSYRNHQMDCHGCPLSNVGTLREYAEETSGCAVRLLTRPTLTCVRHLPPPSAAEVELARAKLQGFAFVGMTGRWNLSICLFHAIFGGHCHDAEFENIRPSPAALAEGAVPPLYDISGLSGWRDPYDGPLFEDATRLFEEALKRYNVTSETCPGSCRGDP